MMVARALNLKTSNVKNPGFKDVETTHPAYKEIAAVVNAGILPKVIIHLDRMIKFLAHIFLSSSLV